MPRAKIDRQPVIDVLIDSGAYSAWRLGSPINLDEYCDFLLANQAWIKDYVSLDVINPGNPEAAALQGRENYLYMRKKGLTPCPVFHVGESLDHLYRMLDDGATYIGLSASSIVNRNAIDDWYDAVWSHLVDSQGLPIVRAHAFGDGREKSLRKYPWYSADTASWIYAAQRTGVVQLESGHKLSNRKDGLGTDAAMDINSLDALTQAELDAQFAILGIDKAAFIEPGKAAYTMSSYCAALYYMGLQKRIRAICPIRHHASGFLAPQPRKEPAIHIPNFNMFLVSGGNPTCLACIARAGHTNMLSSYFHIKANTKKGSTQLGKNFYRVLEQFVYDPVGVASTDERCVKYYAPLKQYLKEA